MNRHIRILLISLFFILAPHSTGIFAEKINKVDLFKNGVPISMANQGVTDSNGILLSSLPDKVDSGEICKAEITCDVGKNYPSDAGYCSIKFKVSRLWITKIVTIVLSTKKIDGSRYELIGKYKIGEESTQWSSYTTIAKFKTDSNSTYNVTQGDIQNPLVVKKM